MNSKLLSHKKCYHVATLVLFISTLVGCRSLRGSDGDLLSRENAPSLELSEFSGGSNSQAIGSATTGNEPNSGIEQTAGISDDGNGAIRQAGGVSDNGGGVVQADADAASYFEGSEKGNRAVSFLSFFRSDAMTARKTYQNGNALFLEAKKNPKQSVREFAKAAGYFRRAGDAAPGSALQQDALFMQAESQFFANELIDATKAYQKLQKDFPRNKYSDKIAARLFSISRYWIETSKAGSDAWYKINLTDNSRPSYDAKGHAVKVLDQIRYDDPTGRLADDATIAAAEEYFRQQEYEKADEFLTDLRETFSDSDHLFAAHVMGIEAKLRVYAGPQYSGLVLEEAETLIRKVRERFPDKLRDQKYAKMIAKASAEVSYHKAERFMTRGTYRENRKEYGAAASEYRRLVAELPTAPQAKKARERLGAIANLPPTPNPPLSSLKTIFPDSRQTTPLETVNSRTARQANGNKTR